MAQKKKTAQKFIDSLNKRSVKYAADIAKITAVLELGKDILVGGYEMKRKLVRQKNLLCDLNEVIKERIELFKKNLVNESK